MLQSVKKLEGLPIDATDGLIGKVKDFYFDDEAWVIRYIVVDTHKWLGGRAVLISPHLVGEPDPSGASLTVTVTKEQVKNSPGIDSDEPVSRRYEKSYLGYYGYPYYWGGMGLWGGGFYPGELPEADLDAYRGYQGYLKAPADHDDANPHLRSCNAVHGYHIQANDGEIGHVQGFLLDNSTWSIRYLVINTSNWWMGHQLILSPEWIRNIDWSQSMVSVDLDRQTIKSAPAYDADVPLLRTDESAIHRHYQRQGYWLEPRSRAAA